MYDRASRAYFRDERVRGSRGHFPLRFGPRFFVALLLGFRGARSGVVVSAGYRRRCFCGMAGACRMALGFAAAPSPGAIGGSAHLGRRGRALGVAGSVEVGIQNDGSIAIRARVVDETPAQFRSVPPDLTVIVKARSSAEASYPVMPAERGDTKLGRIFLRYQSALGFAERWAVAETQQTVRVLPNLEQAKRESCI